MQILGDVTGRAHENKILHFLKIGAVASRAHVPSRLRTPAIRGTFQIRGTPRGWARAIANLGKLPAVARVRMHASAPARTPAIHGPKKIPRNPASVGSGDCKPGQTRTHDD